MVGKGLCLVRFAVLRKRREEWCPLYRVFRIFGHSAKYGEHLPANTTQHFLISTAPPLLIKTTQHFLINTTQLLLIKTTQHYTTLPNQNNTTLPDQHNTTAHFW